jgi:putative FmdB family regulatory protein
MPTYDYICDGCGNEFEAFESIKADPQTICPKCNEAKLRRKIGAGAAIIFKGSGFYQTDYRSDSYKKSAKADAPPEAASAKSADSPAAKTSETTSTAPKAEPAKPSTSTGSS